MSDIKFNKPCRFFAKGQCKNGDGCTYSHDLNQQQQQEPDQGRWDRNGDQKKKFNNDFSSNQPFKRPRFEEGKANFQRRNDNQQQFQKREFPNRDGQPRKEIRLNENSDQPKEQFGRFVRQNRDDEGGNRDNRDNRGNRDNRDNRDNKDNRENFRDKRENNQQRDFQQNKDNFYKRDNRNFNRDNNGDNNQQRNTPFNKWANQFEDNRNNNQDRDNNRYNNNRENFQRDNRNQFRDNRNRDTPYNDRPNFARRAQQAEPKQTQELLQQKQTLAIEGFIQFLQLIQTQAFNLLGLVSQKAITFFPFYCGNQVTLDTTQSKQLLIPDSEIQQGWLQQYFHQYILMASYQKTKSSMNSLVVYLDVVNNQRGYHIADVSLKSIVYCHYIVQYSHLFVFCNDGNIRVFQLKDEGFVFLNKVDLQTPIDCALQTSQDENQKIFIIGLRDGSVLMWNDSQFINIPHKAQGNTLVQIRKDLENRRLQLLFWNKDNGTSQILSLNEQSVINGPHYEKNQLIQSIECIKDHEQKNIMFCGMDLGIMEILNEEKDSGQLSQVSFYPHQVAEDVLHDRILDIQKLEIINRNHVVQKYLIIGRQLNKESVNIELLELLPK